MMMMIGREINLVRERESGKTENRKRENDDDSKGVKIPTRETVD